MNLHVPFSKDDLKRSLAKWVREARQPPGARRTKAFEALCDLAREHGARAEPALPVLLEGLEDADPQIGEKAVWALHYCSPVSLEPLTTRLAHPAALVRERAAHALGSVGDDARAAAPALRALLGDADQAVRSRAAWALGLLHDADAATAAGLIAMVAGGTPKDQESALHAIGNLGRASGGGLDWTPHEEPITTALWNPSSGARRWALYAVQSLRLGPDPEAALLLGLLEREQEIVVIVAALERLKTLATAVDLAPHGRMITNLIARGNRVASIACDVLGAARCGSPETIVALTKALDDDELVDAAIRALWAIRGPDSAHPILKALVRMFDNDAESACDVVCQLGPVATPLLSRVIAALAEEDWDLQWAAADALGAIASSAPETLAALLAAMAHASPIVRSAAAKALARIGAAAVPALKAIAGDGTDNRRVYAAYALGMIGAPAASALPELRAGMRLGQQPFSGCCAIAVAAVAADTAAVPFLVELLVSSDSEAPRAAAAGALGAIGPAAAGAIDALEAARLDEEDDVREAAEEALVQIRGRRH